MPPLLARQACLSAFQEAQGTSKPTVTRSSPVKWQRKLSCTRRQAHLHRNADRKKTWFHPLPDSRKDREGSSQAGKNGTNRAPYKYNKDTAIVILNEVKDLVSTLNKPPRPSNPHCHPERSEGSRLNFERPPHAAVVLPPAGTGATGYNWDIAPPFCQPAAAVESQGPRLSTPGR